MVKVPPFITLGPDIMDNLGAWPRDDMCSGKMRRVWQDERE